MPFPPLEARKEAYQQFLKDFPRKNFLEKSERHQRRMFEYFFANFSKEHFLTQKKFFDVVGALFDRRELEFSTENGVRKYYFAAKKTALSAATRQAFPALIGASDVIGLFDMLQTALLNLQKVQWQENLLKMLAGFEVNIGFDDMVLSKITRLISKMPHLVENHNIWTQEFYEDGQISNINFNKLIRLAAFSAENFSRFLTGFSLDERKILCGLYVSNYPISLFSTSSDQFIAIVGELEDRAQKQDISRLFFNNNREALLFESLRSVCKFIAFYEGANSAFVSEFISRNRGKIPQLRMEDFALIISRSQLTNAECNDITKEYFEKRSGFVLEDFLYILGCISNVEMHQDLLEAAVDNFYGEDFNNMSSENLLYALRLAPTHELSLKIFGKSKAIKTPEDVINFINAPQLDQNQKYDYVCKYVNEKGQSLEIADLAKFAPILVYRQKVELTAVFLQGKPRPNIEQIKEMVAIFDRDLQARISSCALEKGPRAKLVDVIFAAIESTNERNDLDDYGKNRRKINQLIPLLNSSIVDPEEGAQILKLLYANDMVRYAILVNFRVLSHISPKIKSDFIASVASSMSDRDSLTWFVEFLFSEGFVANEAEKLKLIRGHYRESYKVVADFLSQFQLDQEGVLNEAGVQQIKAIFGEDFPFSEYNLADIFSYYYFSDADSRDFADNLSDSFKQRLAGQVKLPNLPYLTVRDYGALQGFVENFSLPPIAKVTQYLLSKKITPPPYDLQVYEIDFSDVFDPNFDEEEGSFKEFSPEKKREITAQFLELQRAENPDFASVIAFFANLYNAEDFAQISVESKEKIYQLFIENKSGFLHAFAQEGLVAKFIAESSSAGHGCVKNIATKFRSILYQTMMQDESAARIYSFYIDKILVPLGQAPTQHLGDINHGGDVSGDPILLNEVINNQLLNFEGFAAQLGEYISGSGDFEAMKNRIFALVIETNPAVNEYVATLEGEAKQKAISMCFTFAMENDAMYNLYDDAYEGLNLLAASLLCGDLIAISGLQEVMEVKAVFAACEKFKKCFVGEFKTIDVEEIKPVQTKAESSQDLESSAGEYIEVEGASPEQESSPSPAIDPQNVSGIKPKRIFNTLV